MKTYNLHNAITGEYLCTYYDLAVAVEMRDTRIARGERVYIA